MNFEPFLIIAALAITLVNLYMFIDFKFIKKNNSNQLFKIDKKSKSSAKIDTYKLEPQNNNKTL